MTPYKRYGDERPETGRPCWIKMHISKKARWGEWERGWEGKPNGWWSLGGFIGPECHPDDLWCYAEAPELPKETR